MGITYTAKEIATAEKLIQEWNANNIILQEIQSAIEEQQGFGFRTKDPKTPFICHPRRVAEARMIAKDVGQRMGGLYESVWWSMQLPSDYPRKKENEDNENLQACFAIHDEIDNFRRDNQYLYFSLTQRIMLTSLIVEIDKLKAKESVIKRAMEALVENKKTLSNENLEKAAWWLYYVGAIALFEKMWLKQIVDKTAYLDPNVIITKKILVDGELGLDDVPHGTLLKDSCGCIYRHVKRKQRRGESAMDYECDNMSNTVYCRLVKASDECAEKVYTRYGYKAGAHGRPIGNAGWTFNKTFTLVKYPNGGTKLRQPRPTRRRNLVEIELNKDK
jgi:hypothetical protein